MHQDHISSIKNRLAASFLLLAACFIVGPAEAQTWKSHLSTDEPGVLYRRHCAACHGPKGDGKGLGAYVLDPPPENFTSEETRAELSRARMIQVLNQGTRKKGKATGMIAWNTHLSPAQIEAVVDYVIVNFMDGKVVPNDQFHSETHDHSTLKVKAVAYPYGLKANAARGKAIYTGNCQVCHGEQGDGRGNPEKMGTLNPRNFHDADFIQFASGFALFSAVSGGRGHMPAWEKTLNNQEIADVSEYVLRTYVKARPHTARAK